MTSTYGFRIVPLVVGWLTIQTSTFYPPALPDEVLEAPVTMWLVEWGEHLLLFDTGATPPEVAHTMGHRHYRRSPDEAPVTKLRACLGISPDDIEVVVLSHLHWDHAANWTYFERAQIVVQADEVCYALHPEPRQWTYFDYVAGPSPCVVSDRFSQVRGATLLPGYPGLTLLPLPGHTPGSQGLLLEMEDRRVILPGDTVPLQRNWQAKPPVINGISWNDSAFHETLRALEAQDAVVLPSHDPVVAAYDGVDLLEVLKSGEF